MSTNSLQNPTTHRAETTAMNVRPQNPEGATLSDAASILSGLVVAFVDVLVPAKKMAVTSMGTAMVILSGQPSLPVMIMQVVLELRGVTATWTSRSTHNSRANRRR
jgi:hypothetical protein